jgi:hypothetical protein
MAALKGEEDSDAAALVHAQDAPQAAHSGSTNASAADRSSCCGLELLADDDADSGRSRTTELTRDSAWGAGLCAGMAAAAAAAAVPPA